MMDILKLCGVAIFAAFAALLLRRMKPETGLVTALGAGVVMAALILPRLSDVLTGVAELAQLGGLSADYMTQLMRVCGVSIMVDLAAQTCRDAGENGLALKVTLAGRVLLLAMALPFMQALLTQILSLWPS